MNNLLLRELDADVYDCIVRDGAGIFCIYPNDPAKLFDVVFQKGDWLLLFCVFSADMDDNIGDPGVPTKSILCIVDDVVERSDKLNSFRLRVVLS